MRFIALNECRCHRPGCAVRVPAGAFACDPDWLALPRRLRKRLRREYLSGEDDDYLAAVHKAASHWAGGA